MDLENQIYMKVFKLKLCISLKNILKIFFFSNSFRFNGTIEEFTCKR